MFLLSMLFPLLALLMSSCSRRPTISPSFCRFLWLAMVLAAVWCRRPDDFEIWEHASKISCGRPTGALPRFSFPPVERLFVAKTMEAFWLFTEVLFRLLKLLLNMLLVSTAIFWGAAYSSAVARTSPSSLDCTPVSIWRVLFLRSGDWSSIIFSFLSASSSFASFVFSSSFSVSDCWIVASS